LKVEEKFLSSAQTFVLKYVFPPLWIGGFGAGTLALWLGAMHSRNGMPLPPVMKWAFLVGWCAGTTFIVWFCRQLKRVRLMGGVLYVSNYWREVAIPLGMVDRVSEIRWINVHPVSLHLRRSSEFGDSIMFIPKTRFFGFSAHPVVAEIEQLIAATRVRDRS
jgi:hypothetical protein